jgi:hypothetical protein
MEIKTLYVCGDSFSAPSSIEEFKGTSYAELTAKKLGWNLVHLARQGCSNGGIRIQIQEAINNRADFVIVGPTSHDRMEIPATAAPYDWKTDHSRSWGNDLQEHLLNQEFKNGYDPAAGIDNVNYGNNSYRMICETIFSLAENYTHPYRSGLIDRDTQTALKYFVNHLYDSNWKKQLDEWMTTQGLFELYHLGIPFSVDPNLLWRCDTIRQKISLVIPDIYLRIKNEETIGYATNIHPLKDVKKDPGYHGEPQSQEYLSNFYVELISNHWKL